MVINYFGVCENVGVTYRKGEAKFDVLKEVFIWISSKFSFLSFHIQI